MDEDPTQQDVGEEVDDNMLGDDVDLPADSPKGDHDLEPESSAETPPHLMDEATNGESLDGKRQEGDETGTGQEDIYPEEDVSMQPDVRTGDEPSNGAAPDGSLNHNVREDTSESLEGGAHGANAASVSDGARRDDA
jgi:hypothetical protein